MVKLRTSVVNTTQRIKTILREEAGYIGNPTNVAGLMRINITFQNEAAETVQRLQGRGVGGGRRKGLSTNPELHWPPRYP